MRWLAVGFVLVMLSGGAGAHAAGSKGTWSRPVTVAECRDICAGPWLAWSARTGTTVVWMDGAREPLFARRLHRDGSPGRQRKITDTFGDHEVGPAIAVAPTGAMVVAWWDGGDKVIRARRLSPRGKLGRVHEVARPRLPHESDTIGELEATVDSAGNATFAWRRVLWSQPEDPEVTPPVIIKAVIHTRTLSARGRLGRSIELPSGRGLNSGPRLASTGRGRVTIAWSHTSSSLHTVRATTLGPGGVGKVRDISVPEPGPADPLLLDLDLAVDSRGNSTVIWRLTDTRARRLDSRARPSGPIALVTPEYNPDGQSKPRVVVDRAGNATFGWFNLAGIQSRRWSAAGTMSALQTISAPDHIGWSPGPEIAVDRAGRATFVWRREIPTGQNLYDHAIHARQVEPHGALGAPHTLASQPACNGCTGLNDPKVVADSRGVVTAAWSATSTNPFSSVRWFRVARLVP